MKSHLHIILIFLLAACSSKNANINSSTSEIDSLKHDSIYKESNEAYFSEIDTFYIVIADTGNDYYAIRQQMFNIAISTGIKIDTLGRYYDKTKNLIQLPNDDEDEVYRGDYFPRRFPSDHLSLEYLVIYNPQSADKTIALVTGIFETIHSADSALKYISSVQPKAFVVKSEMYTGCMH
jgi:hypothetical protein